MSPAMFDPTFLPPACAHASRLATKCAASVVPQRLELGEHRPMFVTMWRQSTAIPAGEPRRRVRGWQRAQHSWAATGAIRRRLVGGRRQRLHRSLHRPALAGAATAIGGDNAERRHTQPRLVARAPNRLELARRRSSRWAAWTRLGLRQHEQTSVDHRTQPGRSTAPTRCRLVSQDVGLHARSMVITGARDANSLAS
jgi:hypothetical protein